MYLPSLDFFSSPNMFQGSRFPQNKIELTARSYRRAQYVWEHPYYPQFYVPISAIKSGLLTKDDAVDEEKSAFLATLKGESRSTNRVVTFERGPLSGLVRFEFGALGRAQSFRWASSHLSNKYPQRSVVWGRPANLCSPERPIQENWHSPIYEIHHCEGWWRYHCRE